MDKNSSLVTRVSPSLGHKRGRYGRRREYAAIVVHVTGSGPLGRYEGGWRPDWAGLDEDSSLLEVALAIYGGVTESAPHYLVHEQEIVQLGPEGAAAWHVWHGNTAQYDGPHWWEQARDRKGEHVDCVWWLDRWAELRSPMDLARGRLWGAERSANRGSVGVELLYPYDAERTTPTAQTWATLAALVQDVSQRRAIDHVLAHSDAHPAERTSGGEPWDPPPWFDRATARQLLGRPLWCLP